MSEKKYTDVRMRVLSHCTMYGHTWQQTLTKGIRTCAVCGKTGQCPTCNPTLLLNVRVAYCFRHGEGRQV